MSLPKWNAFHSDCSPFVCDDKKARLSTQCVSRAILIDWARVPDAMEELENIRAPFYLWAVNFIVIQRHWLSVLILQRRRLQNPSAFPSQVGVNSAH